MGDYVFLDKDGYSMSQERLRMISEIFSGLRNNLNRGDYKILSQSSVDLADGISLFKKTLSRLEEFVKAGDEYLDLWETMQAENQTNAENQGVSSDNYCTDVFGSIYQDNLDERKAVIDEYKQSSAYTFKNAGKSFSEDYNDLTAFQQSGEYKRAMALTAWSEFGNEQLYIDWLNNVISGDDISYVDDKLEAALEGMLENLPEYKESTAYVDFTTADWDALGEKLGVEGLEDIMKNLAGLMKTVGKEIPELSKKDMQVIYDSFEDLSAQIGPGMATYVTKFIEGLNALAKMDKAGKFVGDALKMQEYVEDGMSLFWHLLSNHEIQTRYLDSFKESLLAAGFEHGPVIAKIDELAVLYEQEEQYVINKICDEIYDETSGQIFDLAKLALVKELPGLKGVTFGVDVIGGIGKLVAGTKGEAVQSLIGLQQYDYSLTQSFENYIQMIEDGYATAEDVQRANDVYEILRATKMKEYENMMTIAGDESSEWYILAKQKYEELQEMDFRDAVVRDEINSLTEGSGVGRF